MAFSCKFHVIVCRYTHIYAKGQITRTLISHLNTKNVSSVHTLFQTQKINKRQPQYDLLFIPEQRNLTLANFWNGFPVSQSFIDLQKLQQMDACLLQKQHLASRKGNRQQMSCIYLLPAYLSASSFQTGAHMKKRESRDGIQM